jgi:ATP-dependent Clp protease ATP-binding subunit ClpB
VLRVLQLEPGRRRAPALGARPLRRAIVRHVQDPLAEKMLSGSVGEGTTLRVRHADGEFRFEP